MVIINRFSVVISYLKILQSLLR